MRRYGTSIRKQIQEVASQVVLGTFRAHLHAKQQVTTSDTFMVLGPYGPGLMFTVWDYQNR